jgi:hypothetical protein
MKWTGRTQTGPARADIIKKYRNKSYRRRDTSKPQPYPEYIRPISKSHKRSLDIIEVEILQMPQHLRYPKLS